MNNKKATTLFICCCDNRINPYNLDLNKSRELFIVRNIGNIIPPYGSSEDSVGAAIEYAIEQLKIKEIIVCGHSDCGAMKAVLKSSTKPLHLNNWLKYALPANGFTSPDKLSKANVLHQIKNLMTYPTIIKRQNEGILKIHSWWLDLDTNSLLTSIDV